MDPPSFPANNAEPEVVALDDSLYIRMHQIVSGIITFYEKIVNDPPAETEEFFNKHPKTAAARLQIAPVAIARVLPARKQVQQIPATNRGRLPPGALVGAGKSIEDLKRLAELGGD